ncbi:MAG: hypothetical protein UX50_C0001G0289 [Candidatus Beckwithbacteria bacterium GW2011_GWA1_46_30]|nr:MAG: hypothetical protein UX50_C0001G0289 [Candidatus Beckwithbacteria bacterium GW2011_GWA1_46_30]
MDKINLNKDQKLVVDSFYKVRTKKGLNSFIEDLFSPEETLDLAQRLKKLRQKFLSVPQPFQK